ncbi:MAG TPA: hypothetical protein VGQ83_07495 [Polyangia bacterium]|jgi:hypothetical protein
MCRTLISLALVLVVAGCGGRTGLGVFSDTPPPEDAAVADAPPDATAPEDATRVDAHQGRDGSAGTNCAQIMMCVLQNFSGGLSGLTQCSQGATASGISQAVSVVTCLAQNCYQYFISDAGGQFEALACMVQSCTDQLCACDGIDTQLPPGILICPPAN